MMFRHNAVTLLSMGLTLASLVVGTPACGPDEASPDTARHGPRPANQKAAKAKRAGGTASNPADDGFDGDASETGERLASPPPPLIAPIPKEAFHQSEATTQFDALTSFDFEKHTCKESGGTWHTALLNCVCADNQLYRTGMGCADPPPLTPATPCGQAFATLSRDALKACASRLEAAQLRVTLDIDGLSDAELATLQMGLDSHWSALFPGTLLASVDKTTAVHYTNALGRDMGTAAALWLTDSFDLSADYLSPWDPTRKGADLSAGEATCLKRLAGTRDVRDKPALQSLCRTMFSALRGLRASSVAAAPNTAALTVADLVTADGSLVTVLRGELAPAAGAAVYRVHLKDRVPLARSLAVAGGDTWQLAAFISPVGDVTGILVRKLGTTTAGNLRVTTTAYDATFKAVRRSK